MRPGLDSIYACPYCQARARRENILCGSTFGQSKFWSDWHEEYHYPLEDVRVTRCPSCSGIYWIEDLLQVGEVPKTTFTHVETTVKNRWWFGTQTKIKRNFTESPLKKLPHVVHLDVKGLYQALAELPHDRELGREKYLRVQLWRRFNDRFRKEQVILPTDKEIALNQQNLSALITLYDPQTDPARLFCASVLLGLERFGDSKALVGMVEDERYLPIQLQFFEAAEHRRSEVFLIEW